MKMSSIHWTLIDIFHNLQLFKSQIHLLFKHIKTDAQPEEKQNFHAFRLSHMCSATSNILTKNHVDLTLLKQYHNITVNIRFNISLNLS